jgi:hypothetical protein
LKVLRPSKQEIRLRVQETTGKVASLPPRSSSQLLQIVLFVQSSSVLADFERSPLRLARIARICKSAHVARIECSAYPLTRNSATYSTGYQKKTSRRHVDVNVEERDHIVDDGRSAPLSKADSRRLKTCRAVADHAIRKDERCIWRGGDVGAARPARGSSASCGSWAQRCPGVLRRKQDSGYAFASR